MTEQFESDAMFSLYVLQQQQLAWLYLGKMVNPATGTTERNLEAAKFMIDVLGMIETKTAGNLSKEEEQLLGQVLTTLRLNYLEESRKPESEQSDPASEDAKSDAEQGGDGSMEPGSGEEGIRS